MQGSFVRIKHLLGEENLKKLANSSIIVIGLGGVGSYAVEAIARCGVGTITIVDHDRIEASNINRQLGALSSTVGQLKTEVLGARLKDINPDVNIIKYPLPYDADNSSIILEPRPDYVIDAIDSIPNKLQLIRECWKRNIPLVSSMGMGNRIDPVKLEIADIRDTSVCPLAKNYAGSCVKINVTRG